VAQHFVAGGFILYESGETAKSIALRRFTGLFV
jgi:hypothetical protein